LLSYSKFLESANSAVFKDVWGQHNTYMFPSSGLESKPRKPLLSYSKILEPANSAGFKDVWGQHNSSEPEHEKQSIMASLI
jgi:hypothetical protein